MLLILIYLKKIKKGFNLSNLTINILKKFIQVFYNKMIDNLDNNI